MFNFEKVFRVFKKKYRLIPLEAFGRNSYKTLISTILSARTKDELTFKVSERLFKKAPDIKKLRKLSEEEIKNLIYPVGFYKTKAKYLKRLSEMVDKIPDTWEELIKLPGVGRKTANLVLNRAFNISAIAVDTHVHRITNLLGWVKTKTPEQTEKELVKILPKKYWSYTNKLFVSIGQQFRSKEKLIKFLRENNLIQ